MDTKIPSVMIQPFVENAILMDFVIKNNGNGLLELYFNVHDNTLECRIHDNGIGREESASIKQDKR
jgi:LytS/YehU family sensor histidine kinase